MNQSENDDWKLNKSSLADVVMGATRDGDNFDLGGKSFDLNEAYYDTDRLPNRIVNGRLCNGTLVVGPADSRTTIKFQNVSADSLRIVFLEDAQVTVEFDGGDLHDVTIVNGHSITFNGMTEISGLKCEARVLTFSRCKLVQNMAHHTLQAVDRIRFFGGEADASRLKQIDLTLSSGTVLEFKNIDAERVTVSGHVASYRAVDCIFTSCNIACEAEEWTESDTLHQSPTTHYGKWLPSVTRTLDLTNVTCDGVQVNTEAIASKCRDRSTVDLQRARVQHPWEELRDNYTGTLLVFHLLFLAAFFAPIVVRTSFLGVISQSTGALSQIVPASHDVSWRTYYVWELLLFGIAGYGHAIGWLHALFTALLIVYNAARLYLTYSVTKLRAREEHLTSLGFQTAWPAQEKYSLQWTVHRAMKWLFAGAVVAGVWKVWEAVLLAIRVPHW